MGSAAVNNNNNQQNKNMSSFIEINNKPKPQPTQQQNMIQKPIFLNQNHINSQQSAFNNVMSSNNSNNIFSNPSQFINSPSEFQPPSSKHGQFSRNSNISTAVSNNSSNNNNLFNHHLNQLPNSISSPICNPSSPLTAIPISQPVTASSSSAQHQLQFQQNQSQKLNPINLDSSQSANAKRPSFIARNNSNTDRKPEELDALANELLNEFSCSRKSEINNNQLGATNAPLSRLSSSSSSSSSTARSSSSSSSSSNESGELIAPHISDANEEIGSNSQTPSSNHSSDSHHSSASVTNKSGTLIIHRDANSTSHFSEKIKNLKIDNLPDLLLPQQQQQQSNLANNNNNNNNSNNSNNNIQKFILPDPTTTGMPQTFVSYNPNSKSIINHIGVAGSGGSSFDTSSIPAITSLSGATASNVPSLGIGSVIQPLNESQMRKANQVLKIYYGSLIIK